MLVKLLAGRVKKEVDLTCSEGRFYANFSYNQILKDEIKNMDGSKWDPEDKIWSFKDTRRNRWQLEYLLGNNPYIPYDSPLVVDLEFARPLMQHQRAMTAHMLQRRQCIIAAEMGVGKTLAAIEAMERSLTDDWWWVAPKSALASFQLEMFKWKIKVRPRMLTYEAMTKLLEQWGPNSHVPHGVVFDESSRIKNPTAKRSQAASYLTDHMRDRYDSDLFVILMSGSPAPKSPLDWYHQCEVARPGFLKEGNIHKLQKRLGKVVQKESKITGGVYPELVTWWDDANKCAECGILIKNHKLASIDHPFKYSTNEIEALYKRMKGLVLVQFKKDCLDIPDKIYKRVVCEPNPSTLRALALIKKRCATAIQTLTLSRELSDGFQYQDIPDGMTECPLCHGNMTIEAPDPEQLLTEDVKMITVECPTCGGVGQIQKTTQEAIQVDSPKIDALRELLEDHEDVGRIVIYAGFKGSIDKCCDTVKKAGWEYIRVDGRGWQNSYGGDPQPQEMLKLFQRLIVDGTIEKLAFIGHPGSAGMGLTLTASPSIVYYSNDFNAENRIQSEDRIHRAGMDINRGATIFDIIHLDTDLYVLENLKKKRVLQALTLGQFTEEMEAFDKERLL